MNEANSLFRLVDVTKTFTNGKTALHHIHLTIHEGESIGIVGESGSGKSTLARLLLGFEPLSSGTIYYGEKNLATLSNKEKRAYWQTIQMIFQNPIDVIPARMTMQTFLSEGLRNYQLANKQERTERLLTLLKQVGLDDTCLDRLPHQLSGGQLQRIVIARALSVAPKIMIYDEATSALDVSVQKQVLALLKQLKQVYQMTNIFIGHDIRVVQEMVDRIIVMQSGEIVDVITKDTPTAAYQPYTQQLFATTLTIDSLKPRR